MRTLKGAFVIFAGIVMLTVAVGYMTPNYNNYGGCPIGGQCGQR
jgi:hypothetical protein